MFITCNMPSEIAGPQWTMGHQFNVTSVQSLNCHKSRYLKRIYPSPVMKLKPVKSWELEQSTHYVSSWIGFWVYVMETFTYIRKSHVMDPSKQQMGSYYSCNLPQQTCIKFPTFYKNLLLSLKRQSRVYSTV